MAEEFQSMGYSVFGKAYAATYIPTTKMTTEKKAHLPPSQSTKNDKTHSNAPMIICR
jgi:hypothetical protein